MKKKGKHGARQAGKVPRPQTAASLAEVLQLYQAGQFIAAEQCVRRLLDEPESRVAAWKILGAILQQQGRFVEAMAAKEHAVGLAPEDPFVHYNLATALQSLGRLQEAVKSYQAAIRLKPDHAEAHSNMGVALRDLGHPEAAEACYREAIRLKPDFDKAHSNLGLVLQDAGRLIEAVACYQTAVKLNGGLPEPLNNLGVALKELGRVEEAVQCYQAAISLKPDYAAAHNNAGVGLKALGRLQEAAVMYQRAIALDPDYAEAYSNYGVLLKDAGQLAESEVAYRHALRIRPEYAQAFNNLGITLKEQGKIREAESCYRQALRIQPQYPEAYSNLGVLLKELGAYSQAIECYQQALRIKPDYIDARSNLLFALNFVTSVPPETVVAVAKEFGALVSRQAQPKCPVGPLNANPVILRIGFVSGDLRHHPVGFFVEALLQYLAAHRCEVLAFPTSPKADDVTARLRPLFKDWIPLYGKSDHAAAQLIHEQGVHVLVDLSGHTAYNRLGVFAFRPAPVQVSWLGYFATTGLPEMDYFLGDPYMAPADEAAHFTERLWQLKETWLCLTPPRGAPQRATAPMLHNGYVTFGCFGNLAKMGDAVINLWASILRDCPSARLFLKSKQLADDAVVRNIKSRFAALGVAEGRLILEGLSSRAAYLDAYQRIDMVLDTFPYPGGTTSAEAIWMGVPVLTLKGDRFLSHLGESIAHNAENADWIAQDADDYRRKAVAFAADVARLTDPRHADRQRLMQTPLFDAPRFAANFAEAMWGMYGDTLGRSGS